MEENGIIKDGEKLKEFGQIKWYILDKKFDTYKDTFAKDKEKELLAAVATLEPGKENGMDEIGV